MKKRQSKRMVTMNIKTMPRQEQEQQKKGEQLAPEITDTGSQANQNQIEKFTFQNKKKKNFYSYKYNPNENTVFLNFDVKDFEKQDLVASQNILNYGIVCYKCTSQKKEPQQILIMQNSQNPQQYDVAYTVGQLHMIEQFSYNLISELQEGSTFKLPRRDIIMHATCQNTLSFLIESQNLYVTLIFPTQEIRDALWLGFQNSVIEYLCNQTIALNQQSLTHMFEDFREQEPNKMMDLQDMQDLLRQIKIQTSKNQLQKYFNQKDKEKEKRIDLVMAERIVKQLVDKSEVREIFKYYTPKEFLNSEEKTPCMSVDDFRRFLFNVQKEDKDAQQITEIFHKLHRDKKNQIDSGQPTHLISFQQFCKYIYSQKNTIFNPKNLEAYMDIDRPITEYYVNCSHHFYNSKIDIETLLMIQKDKEGPDFDNKYLPIHFILHCGVRCASIDVWDGDECEPVILYGYTMSSKVKLSEVLKVLVKYAFKNNKNPFFLELDFHCQPAVMENVKKHIEEILLPYLYVIPSDYQEVDSYPTLYELQKKIILMGKLPFNIRNDLNAEYKKLLLEQLARQPDSIDEEFRNMEEQEKKDQNQKNKNIQMHMLTQKKQANSESNLQKTDNKTAQPKLKNHIDQKFNPEPLLQFGSQHNSEESMANLGTINDINKDGENNEQIVQRNYEYKPFICTKNIKRLKENPVIGAEKHYSLYIDRFIKTQSSFFDVFELSKNEYEQISAQCFPSWMNNLHNSKVYKDSPVKNEDYVKQSNQSPQNQATNLSYSCINTSPPLKSNLSNMILNQSYQIANGQQQAQTEKLNFANLANTAADGFPDLKTFTQINLMKINPSGKKADSNNFDPCLPLWQGVQFLMLSHHQFDSHCLLYQSFFMQNGGQKGGFILKPPELRSDYQQESIKSISDIKRMVYYIKIISGSQLRSLRGEQVDPQVNVILRQPISPISQEASNNLLKNTLWGIQDHSKQYQPTQIFNSSIVINNNSNPIFEFEFKISVSDPDLSFLTFNVVNTRYDNLIGWYSIPINCIRQGYRIIPLKDENMTTIQNSCLLCNIKITQDI